MPRLYFDSLAHCGCALVPAGMHTSISEILKEKSLKPSRRSLPCLAQSQTHPINLNHFLSVPLSPEPKPEADALSQSVSTSCSLLPPHTGQSVGRLHFDVFAE